MVLSEIWFGRFIHRHARKLLKAFNISRNNSQYWQPLCGVFGVLKVELVEV
jgi:hypothetical protein